MIDWGCPSSWRLPHLLWVLLAIPSGARAELPCCDSDDCGLPRFPLPRPFVETELQGATGRELASFYADLARTAAGQGKTRIAFFGDSHTATDRLPGRLRENLQGHFGHAGAGLVMPGKPRSWYRHELAVVGDVSGWRIISPPRRAPEEPLRVGISGFALSTRWRKPLLVRFGRFRAGQEHTHAGRFEVHFLKQPGGGGLRAKLDGKQVGVVSTQAETMAFGRHAFTAQEGLHRLSLSGMADGEVTVFGVVGEREQSGVIVDTLGNVGARVREQLFWDAAIYDAQLSARRPNLVVLAYGTNEAMDAKQPLAEYEAELHDVVGRIRHAVPNAACLLVGPTDHPERFVNRWGRRYRDRPRTAQIIAAQRRVARHHGCATFDLVHVTGGPMSMRRLVKHRRHYGAPDHVHFTRAGYRALGDALSGALIRGYGRWLETACSALPGTPAGAQSP
ncbi:MAG: GDSL-type esterase/lipase family protein [Myxococcales bacterium]|nr:GDSL-type esterase/lipase family protein [Myxococcales bacterium]MDD9966574.1 GDSL-type esterase/lipase family protein [Myxococcales bacterium]